MDRTAPRLVVAVLLLVALLTGSADPAPAATLDDSNARAHLEEMERRGVLRDSIWAQAYWARSRSAPSTTARVADLRWTLRFDPELNAARWELAGLLLKQRDPEFSTHAVEAVRSAIRTFPGQQRIALWLFTLGIGVTFTVLIVMTTLAIAKTIARLHHAIRERLLFLPIEARAGAALLTLALPLVLAATLPPTAALFWALLYGAVGAWSMLDKRERRTAVATLVLLALSPLALLGWSHLTAPGDPSSYLHALWSAQSSADPASGQRVGGKAPVDAPKDADYWASLALVQRRQGRYAMARRHLEKACELAPRDWRYVNNLGNVQLLDGDADAALATYRRGQEFAPREPLLRVNEAQAWVQKLQFNRADEALAEANRLGYRLPNLLNSDANDVIVRDRTLSSSVLWSRFLHGESAQHALSVPRAAGLLLALPFPLEPRWVSLALFLVIGYCGMARGLPRAFSCDTCGKSICRKCHYRVQRQSLCGHCYAIRRDVKAPLIRQQMMDDRRRSVTRWTRLLGAVVSFLAPGSGHAIRGRRGPAQRMLALAAVLVLTATAGILWPDPTPNQPGLPSLPWLIGIGAVYAGLALLSLRASRHATSRLTELSAKAPSAPPGGP